MVTSEQFKASLLDKNIGIIILIISYPKQLNGCASQVP